MTKTLKYTEHSYATANELQKLGIWQFPATTATTTTKEPKYWLVYIHGGVWRDPRITHLSAEPAISKLLAHPWGSSRVAGIASLSYRLSPHPRFPQDPATIPPSELRVARHPDHISDVRSALAFLRLEYGVGDEEKPYILCGHSCGATLAFQVLMGLAASENDQVPLPDAVVGIEGMYDMTGLNARFRDEYRGMISGAFGGDEDVWIQVSPACFRGSFRENWGDGVEKKTVVLAWSPDDLWIDMAEIDAMEKALDEDGVNVVAYRGLKGGHDEIWEDGTYVANILIRTIEELDTLSLDTLSQTS